MATKATSSTKKAGKNDVQALSDFRYQQLRVGRGQVFSLKGAPNDARLLAFRYVQSVEAGTPLIECGTCGALFVDEHWLKIHGDTWHTYECGCGWIPAPHSAMDKDSQMRRHRRRCEVSRAEFEEAHKRHLKSALEVT